MSYYVDEVLSELRFERHLAALAEQKKLAELRAQEQGQSKPIAKSASVAVM